MDHAVGVECFSYPQNGCLESTASQDSQRNSSIYNSKTSIGQQEFEASITFGVRSSIHWYPTKDS